MEWGSWLETFVHRTQGSNLLIEKPFSKFQKTFHSFTRWFLPCLGVNKLEKALVNISVAKEILANNIDDAIRALQEEVSQL